MAFLQTIENLGFSQWVKQSGSLWAFPGILLMHTYGMAILVGVIAGPGREFSGNGLGAVLFYLLAYGVMNLGAFAVLAALERKRPDGSADEIDAVADLRGLCQTHPMLGWTMVISSMGLLGLPLAACQLGQGCLSICRSPRRVLR